MPSQTFLNLEKEKQDKIITAAIEEFCRCDYHDASINQIILKSNISRGSFYMYFKDKDDLFAYIMHIRSQKFNDTLINAFKEYNGDLYKTFCSLFDLICSKVSTNNYDYLFKNTFIFLSLHKDMHNVRPFYLLYDQLKDKINIQNIKNVNVEEAFVLLTHILFSSVAEYIRTKDLHVRDVYIKRICFICYGIYKEDKEC